MKSATKREPTTDVRDTGLASAPPAWGWVPTAAMVRVATFVNYLGWLGWDRTKYLGPDGSLHGPYEPWQIVGLVLVLSAIAAAAGWLRRPWMAAGVTTVVMMISFAVSGAMDPDADGLFIVGAFMVAVGTFLGIGLVAGVAMALARALVHRKT
jgi:hypothetical protein